MCVCDKQQHTPISSTSILSNPSGPKELLTMFDSDMAAITMVKIYFFLF
jgi:hypothetical protein